MMNGIEMVMMASMVPTVLWIAVAIQSLLCLYGIATARRAQASRWVLIVILLSAIASAVLLWLAAADVVRLMVRPFFLIAGSVVLFGPLFCGSQSYENVWCRVLRLKPSPASGRSKSWSRYYTIVRILIIGGCVFVILVAVLYTLLPEAIYLW